VLANCLGSIVYILVTVVDLGVHVRFEERLK
jgi:hypothetical protein